MKEWSHKVSEAWLQARKQVVTATELQSLMVGKTKWTKNQKAGVEVAPAFAALWGAKHSTEELDPWSYGAAARGHILEPYAIREYNANHPDTFFHWDDCIICNNGLGFSPDAMDVPQETLATSLDIKHGEIYHNDLVVCKMPTSILEIKSYSIDHHMKCITSKKKSLKERYQVAVAMMVIPGLECGTLAFYNPNVPYMLHSIEYKRHELQKEIEELSEVLDMWNKTCRYFDSLPYNQKQHYTENLIYREYIESKPSNTMMFT